MLQSIDKKIKLFLYSLLFILLSTQITKDQYVKKKTAIKKNYIKVYGLHNEENLKIEKNLNSLIFDNIFFIKKDIFYNVLDQNNLIESFYIKKIYPNLIKINIKQTKLLAITNLNNKKYYIGSNGKMIHVDLVKDFNKKLPFVFGRNFSESFIKLKKIIDESKFQFSSIDTFYYFPSNRWDIKTKNGFLIKLPEKNILKSLQFANLIKFNQELKSNNIIDLRIPNYMISSNE